MLKKIAEEFDVDVPKSAADKMTEKAIHRHFSRSKKKMWVHFLSGVLHNCDWFNFRVLVLDEIDQLEGRGQQVLYKLFEWPVLLGPIFTLIGVANSLDFTHRVLPRLEARASCRPVLLHFAPYSKQQLLDILNHRLAEVRII
jgi:Cdc6-like AAA superfamily ATPase